MKRNAGASTGTRRSKRPARRRAVRRPVAENALPLDMIERELLAPGMTSGQLADAVIARLGLELGKYTVIAKQGTPGMVFVQTKTRPTDSWADQPAEAVIEMCRDLWR